MIDPNVFEHFFKTLMAAEILYVLLITFSKLSVIALLWRIFYLTTMRWPLIALLVINGGWVVATVSTQLSLLRPKLTRLVADTLQYFLMHTYSRLLGYHCGRENLH